MVCISSIDTDVLVIITWNMEGLQGRETLALGAHVLPNVLLKGVGHISVSTRTVLPYYTVAGLWSVAKNARLSKEALAFGRVMAEYNR